MVDRHIIPKPHLIFDNNRSNDTVKQNNHLSVFNNYIPSSLLHWLLLQSINVPSSSYHRACHECVWHGAESGFSHHFRPVRLACQLLLLLVCAPSWCHDVHPNEARGVYPLPPKTHIGGTLLCLHDAVTVSWSLHVESVVLGCSVIKKAAKLLHCCRAFQCGVECERGEKTRTVDEVCSATYPCDRKMQPRVVEVSFIFP